MTERGEPRPRNLDVGRFIVVGAGLGTLVFAFTHNAMWIGIGAAVGVLIGGIWGAVGTAGRGGEHPHR